MNDVWLGADDRRILAEMKRWEAGELEAGRTPFAGNLTTHMREWMMADQANLSMAAEESNRVFKELRQRRDENPV